MRIVVPIKQVPETKAVKMDEKTGTVIRDGVESIVNPLDLYAIEIAVQLKEQHGGEVIVISMGPMKAITAIKEAISMGADKGILISDKKFAGSDTWATSYILGEAVKKIDDVDLIICGERATDGDTGQVGPEMAAYLGLPTVTYVNKVIGVSASECKVHRLVEDGEEEITASLPVLLTVVKEVSDPRLPTLRGKLKAKKIDVPVWTMEELQLDPANIGLKGSPTQVVKIFRPKVTRSCEKLVAADEEQLEKAVSRLNEFLREATEAG